MPNEQEVEHITSTDLDAGIEILSKTVPTLGIKLGAKGGLAINGDQTVEAKSLKVDVVDTIGAGDSFDAGFIYGFLNRYSLKDTLTIACACGSLSTRASGGVAAQANLKDLQRLGIPIK
jgi:sugar/nucleoside kinase (ribokinase family)